MNCLQMLLFDITYSILHDSLDAHSYSFKYCYISLTILLNRTNLFTHSLMIKRFYLTLSGAISPDQSGPWCDVNEGIHHVL